jgi:hypothetical protein
MAPIWSFAFTTRWLPFGHLHHKQDGTYLVICISNIKWRQCGHFHLFNMASVLVIFISNKMAPICLFESQIRWHPCSHFHLKQDGTDVVTCVSNKMAPIWSFPFQTRWRPSLVICISTIDISQYRLLFGFSLLYTHHVPFELLDNAVWRESCGGGGQRVFLNLTTII